MKKGIVASNLLFAVPFVVFTCMYLFPVLCIFVTSIKPDALTFVLPPVWIFRPTLANYSQLFSQTEIGRFLLNSIVITCFSTVLSLVIGGTAGYSFSRYRPGGTVLPYLVLIGRMIPPMVIAVPLFAIARRLDLLDTKTILIVACVAFNAPLTMWLMKGYIDGVPLEYDEAAIMDGASTWTILTRVILPLVKPGVMATGVLNFIFCWNEFLFALIFTVYRAKTEVAPFSWTGCR